MNYRETLELLRAAHEDPVDEAVYAAVRARIRVDLTPRLRWGWICAATAVAMAVVAAVGEVAVERRMRVAALPRVTLEVPGAPEWRNLARAARKAARRPVKPEEVLVKIETSDPDVVIYWIAEAKGEDTR